MGKMREFFIVLVGSLVAFFAFAVEKPEPFGLKLGTTTKSTALSIITSEGGRVVSQGYKKIKGDIINPNVEGIEVEGLPVDNLLTATFWFYKDKLFLIEYTFPLSMSKEEFNWVSWSMYLIYEHIPLSKEVEKSDQEVFQKETAKPRRGL